MVGQGKAVECASVYKRIEGFVFVVVTDLKGAIKLTLGVCAITLDALSFR